jgi:hypothetical protein
MKMMNKWRKKGTAAKKRHLIRLTLRLEVQTTRLLPKKQIYKRAKKKKRVKMRKKTRWRKEKTRWRNKSRVHLAMREKARKKLNWRRSSPINQK